MKVMSTSNSCIHLGLERLSTGHAELISFLFLSPMSFVGFRCLKLIQQGVNLPLLIKIMTKLLKPTQLYICEKSLFLNFLVPLVLTVVVVHPVELNDKTMINVTSHCQFSKFFINFNQWESLRCKPPVATCL